MRRVLASIVILSVITIPLAGSAQIYPPKPGVELPQSYLEKMKQDREAFRFKRAWIQKVERIKKNREAYINDRGFYNRQLLAPVLEKELAVTGTVQVPVFMVKYSNTGADPYPTSTLDTKLFTGPFSPQTLTDYYDEISYGDLNMTGTVYGWVLLPNPDTYYEGGCYGLCGAGAVDELIITAVSAYDASVDYGQYDNDGPDGVPNSGDDDGYVDFAAFVQPESGAECGNSNIWSHRFSLTGWGVLPWTSNDPAAGGGFIKVDDYVIQPAYNCGGATVIDIGVFCHEFGHALGLPDLYDTDGGSEGIGHWGLMGSGSWNTVTQPSHMCAWSKSELGWTDVIRVGTNLDAYSIDNVEFNREVYRLDVMTERWRRESGTACVINGTYSMRCGLLASEAAPRIWPGLEGYGNGWDEKVSREFSYDGSTPVTLQYDYDYDSEPTYDFTYVRIDVNGTVSTVQTYDGAGSGTETLDLTPYLSGSGASSYVVSFEFESDYAASDEDGFDNSTCGPFVFDDLSVVGGGENYFTDFETREDGWAVDMGVPSEHFYVENRQPLGSDAAVHGGGGLNVWHVDDDAANTYLGNTGGSSGNQPHAVALEQADGLDHLGLETNRGDAGDPYPGSTNNMMFDAVSTPNSNDYQTLVTNVVVALTSGNGDPITTNMSGCWFSPMHASHAPVGEDNDKVVDIDIYGGGFVKGGGVRLIKGTDVLTASSVEWVGHDFIIATVDLYGAQPGVYDVEITNPCDGQVVAPVSFTVNNVIIAVEDRPVIPNEFDLGQNYPNPFNPTTLIPFDIKERVAVTLKIYNLRGQVVRTLVNDVLEAKSYSIAWDGRNASGAKVSSGVYFYKLVAGDFQDVRKLVLMK